jgi:hypothetical protein
MQEQTFWTIRKTGNPKFPYRLTIRQGKEILLDLVCQDQWPGTKGNIFCLRASGDNDKEGEEIERTPVVSYKGYGKRLTVILDRPKKKRCSFLFLTKKYKSKPGEYEQIFWQTQQGLTGHKSNYKLSYNRREDMTVFVDSGERYPWKIPGAQTIRENLPLGDYAIKDDFGLLAVVERKTMNNLMAELGNLKKFHQHLSELEDCRNAALVVEASYGDFLDPKKIAPYTGHFAAKALGEAQGVHPNLPVIFAGNRKNALVWTRYFFFTISSSRRDGYTDIVKESTVKYGSKPTIFKEDEMRRLVFTRMPESFTTSRFRKNVPERTRGQVKSFLEKMQNEGHLSSEKQGKHLVWKKVSGS